MSASADQEPDAAQGQGDSTSKKKRRTQVTWTDEQERAIIELASLHRNFQGSVADKWNFIHEQLVSMPIFQGKGDLTPQNTRQKLSRLKKAHTNIRNNPGSNISDSLWAERDRHLETLCKDDEDKNERKKHAKGVKEAQSKKQQRLTELGHKKLGFIEMSDGDDDEDGGEDEYEDIDPSEHDPNYAEVCDLSL